MNIRWRMAKSNRY